MMYSFDVFDAVDSEYKYESIQYEDSYYDEANDDDRDSLIVESLDDVEVSADEFLDELFDL